MFGASVLVCWAGGTLKYNGYTLGNGLALLLLLVGFIIQEWVKKYC